MPSPLPISASTPAELVSVVIPAHIGAPGLPCLLPQVRQAGALAQQAGAHPLAHPTTGHRKFPLGGFKAVHCDDLRRQGTRRPVSYHDVAQTAQTLRPLAGEKA